jgi:hypothetical protein
MDASNGHVIKLKEVLYVKGDWIQRLKRFDHKLVTCAALYLCTLYNIYFYIFLRVLVTTDGALEWMIG